MARALLATQLTSRTGILPSYTAATADGHAFNNEGQAVYLHVKNSTTTPLTVTIDNIAIVDGVACADRAVAIAGSAESFIGPFQSDIYGQVNSTLGIRQAVHINTSTQAGVTYAAIKLGPK